MFYYCLQIKPALRLDSAQLAPQGLHCTAGTPSSSALLATPLKFKSRLALMVFIGKKLVLALLRPKCSFISPWFQRDAAPTSQTPTFHRYKKVFWKANGFFGCLCFKTQGTSSKGMSEEQCLVFRLWKSVQSVLNWAPNCKCPRIHRLFWKSRLSSARQCNTRLCYRLHRRAGLTTCIFCCRPAFRISFWPHVRLHHFCMKCVFKYV